MMKRILTLLLALALCLSLPCAALADTPQDTDPPQWQVWGYDSLQELLEAWGWSKAEYYDYIAWSVAQVQEYPGWRKAYLAAHPGCAAQLLAEDAKDPLWKQWGHASAKDFETWMGVSYKDYLTDKFLEELFSDEWHAAYNLRKRVERGGPAEGVGVMWMGEYIRFADAQPAIVNDRTMIPVRTLMEKTGAQVDFQDGVVVLNTKDAEIRFRAGDAGATLTTGNKTSTIRMDVAPFIDHDRAYVPLRFFSQALGYDVQWDSDYKTAVILDKDSIIADIDKDFKTVNGYLTAQAKSAESAQRLSGSISGKLTVFDTLSGNKTADLSGTVSGVVKGNDTDVKYTADFRRLTELLLGQLPGIQDKLDRRAAKLLSALGSVEAETIVNAESGKTYSKTSLTAILTDGKAAADTWLVQEAADQRLSARLGKAASVGALLYGLATEDGGSAVDVYDELLAVSGELAACFGDKCFRSVGGGKELTIDAKKLPEALRKALGSTGEKLEQQDAALTLRIDTDGSARLSGELTAGSGLLGGKCSFELYSGPARRTVSVDYHVRNLLELTMRAESGLRTVQEAPRKAPPAGSALLDMDTYREYAA